MSIRKLVFAALLAALSLTLFIIESMIPPVLPVPGFRIGLAGHLYIADIFVECRTCV